MQSTVYTQDDLKQILQKVISQRPPLVPVEPHKTGKLPQQHNPPQELPTETPISTEEPNDAPLLTTPEMPEFSPPPLTIPQEEESLPNIYLPQELSRSPEPQIVPAGGIEASTEASKAGILQTEQIEKLTEENERLAKDLEQAKIALTKLVKKKNGQANQEQSEEIQKYKEQCRTLTLALQEAKTQNDKTPEIEELKEENEKAKLALRELAAALHETKEHLKKRDEELIRKDLLNQGSLHDSQEAKLRLLRLIADKKELEDKITALSCEKATLAARLQSLQQKTTQGIETQSSLNSKLTELTSTLETVTQELAATQTELQEKKSAANSHQLQNEKLMQDLQQLQENHEAFRNRISLSDAKIQELTLQLEAEKTNHSQELSVCQACLVERSQALDEEQKKHRLLKDEHLFVKKRLEEQENHLRLLEQHLGRRVKECALLSKQLEEQMDRISGLQTQVAASEKKCIALESEVEEFQRAEQTSRQELDSKTRKFEHERAALLADLQAKEQELAMLRQVQMQFSELEGLFKKSSEIIATKPQEVPCAPPMPQSQKEFFNQVSPLKPSKTSFFD